MRVSYTFLITIVCSINIAISQAQTANSNLHDGKLLSQAKYLFPSFDEASNKTDAEKYATREEYEKAVSDSTFEFSRLNYSSDGMRVNAYLYKPSEITGKLPVIIFNRGSFVRGDIAPELITMFHRLALEGFAIIAPMYRQSDGAEGKDEMGGGDLNDLMNLLPLLKSLNFVDTTNIFMYGESRGGVMTYLAMRKGFPIKAAAVFGAITDMGGYIAENAKGFTPELLDQIWPGYEQNKKDILLQRSALEWPAELNSPIMIFHGGNDRSVNPIQSLRLADKLQALGREYQLIIYSGDNHILTKNRIKRDRETVDWFKAHLD